jgi:hypothetical protein
MTPSRGVRCERTTDGQIEAGEGASIEIQPPLIRTRGAGSKPDGRSGLAAGARVQHAGNIALEARRFERIGGGIEAPNGGHGSRAVHGTTDGSMTSFRCLVVSIDEQSTVRAGSGGDGGDGIDGDVPAEMRDEDDVGAGKILVVHTVLSLRR